MSFPSPPETWSARQVAHAVHTRQLSTAEVAKSCIQRLNALEPQLNAFSHHDPAKVLEQAQWVDQQLAGGADLPMAGVLFTVKDNLWLENAPATFGSMLFKDFVAPHSSWCVERLQSLGAIALGVTTCSEFACMGITETLVHGVTRNPWDLNRTPGGSSGGAVASLAAGIGHLALATDAGGSTRRPAAHTGLVGMKPTLGRVPNAEGFDDPNHLLSVIGQLARNVEDAAWMLDALTAWDPADPLSCPDFGRADAMEQLCQALPPLRIAWSPTLGCELAIDADVLACMEQAVEQLKTAGWKIEKADPLWPAGAREYPLIAIQQAGLAQRFGDIWRKQPQLFVPAIGEQIEQGLRISGSRITQLLKMREEFHKEFSRLHAQYDALLSPTSPVEAWPVGLLGPAEIGGQPAGPRGHAAFTPIFNYGGVPAVSVPCGFGRNQLPLGLQISGPRFADARVLQLAWHAENIWRLDMRSPLMR